MNNFPMTVSAPKDQESISKLSAKTFYCDKGISAAFRQARIFTGKRGKIATLPDLIDAQLATKPGEVVWERYFTTLTAEYLGRTRGGNKIIIVAHGIGPMSTLNGILGAYSYEIRTDKAFRRGGRISQSEFNKLESGIYGPVQIVDFEQLLKRYQYPLIEDLRVSQALQEPLIHARLGPRSTEYILKHARAARDFHRQEGRSPVPTDPYIITMEDAASCSYRYATLESRKAFAHLLSVSQLVCSHHEGAPQEGSLVRSIRCHEKTNGVRLLALRENK